MKKIYEEIDFWNIFREVLFDPERLSHSQEEVEDVLNLLSLEPPSSILDLACGFGRHSLLLSQKGFSVTGIDFNSSYLEEAEKASLSSSNSPRWIKSDMRDFKRENSFNAILSLYTSFGYFEDSEEDLLVLENAFHSLKPKGKILLDLPGKELIARDFIERACYPLGEGSWFIAQRTPVDNWGKVLNEWTLLKEGKEFFYSFEQTLFSAHEITYLLHKAGFSEVQIVGSWKGSLYDLSAERLIAIGKKN